MASAAAMAHRIYYIIKHKFSFMNPIRLGKRCRYLITEMARRMIYEMMFGSLAGKGNGLLPTPTLLFRGGQLVGILCRVNKNLFT